MRLWDEGAPGSGAHIPHSDHSRAPRAPAAATVGGIWWVSPQTSHVHIRKWESQNIKASPGPRLTDGRCQAFLFALSCLLEDQAEQRVRLPETPSIFPRFLSSHQPRPETLGALETSAGVLRSIPISDCVGAQPFLPLMLQTSPLEQHGEKDGSEPPFDPG